MKAWLSRVNRHLASISINGKINIIIIAFLCIPFLLLGLIWFQKSNETIKKNARQVNQELVRQTTFQLDAYFTDLERSTFPMVSNPLIQDFMKLDPDDYLELNAYRTQIERNLLPNLLFGRTDIYGFSIVSQRGVFATYGNTDRERAAKLLELDNLTDRETYKVMGLTFDHSSPIITVIRKFWDTKRYETTGFLMFDLSVNQVSRIVQNIKLGETGTTSLIDANGVYVYHTDPELLYMSVPQRDKQFFMEQPEGYFFKGKGSSELLTVFHRSPLNGWIMVSEVPLKELTGDLIATRNLSIWVGILLILLVLVMLSGFSYYLSRSLLLLQRLMKRAENGDLNVSAPERRDDEIGKLNRSFNKMVQEIRRLIEVVHISELKEKELQLQQRDAVMMALQSQINPHFLYNTLEVINSHALVEGIIPISNMTTALSDLFRYSVRNPNEIVTLKEEIEHLRSYFEIQKERYRSLQIELDTNDQQTSLVKAARLLIQPIVENAFIHGYERKKLRPSYIGIHGELMEDAYLVTITDHGGGMAPEEVEELNQLFEAGQSESSHQNTSDRLDTYIGSSGRTNNRIGMWNVHHRIQLLFGASYGLQITKSDPNGTIVQLKLPIESN